MESWQESNTVIVWLVVSFLMLILLVGVLLFFTQIYVKRKIRDTKMLGEVKLEHQKKMLFNSIETQEKERSRIALEIHDGLIFDLSALSLMINNPNKIQEAQELLKSCTSSARQISHDLTPPLIESCQLNEILEDTLYQVNTHAVSFFQSGLVDFDAEVSFKLNIVRIVQEMINNTIKHAKAEKISLAIRASFNYWAMIYSDNGVGMIDEEQNKGLGLRNITMRVDVLNGHYKIKTAKGKGIRCIVLIPITRSKS